ncbi:MAG: hypothetical protein ACJASB_000906 [Shewanella psychromarinicola]|uniref:hypothetical protein n=1 Tax=Shewanella psychromarinicola TaxID=2487742 RepID=UPI003EEC7581
MINFVSVCISGGARNTVTLIESQHLVGTKSQQFADFFVLFISFGGKNRDLSEALVAG